MTHWKKIPDEVLYGDPRVTLTHIRVYGLIVRGVRRGKDFSWVGQRLIAEKMGISQRTAGRRIKELVDFGHIEIVPAKDGLRTCYRVLSDAFKTVPRKGYERRQQSTVSSTVRRAGAWAKTQQGARGAVLDEILGKESA